MLSLDTLKLDAAAAVAEIELAIREQVLGTLRRRGAVVGVSGGIDSSVVAALCARALGRERVLALLMPERDSGDAGLALGRALGAHLGVETLVEDIGPILAAAGCYERQAAAIRLVFPEYGEGYRCKVALPPVADGERLNVTQLIIETPSGERKSARLPLQAYLQLIAATNFKQRTRTMMAYHHADRLHHAVAGTPNLLEYDQGFFVKQGDGAADFKPIAHLYKTQVYQLAEFLGVPQEIRSQLPTTATFSLPQTQEEFYFGLPYGPMDLCLYGRSHDLPAAEVAAATGLTAAQVERVYRDIDQKRRTTRPLHLGPLLVRPLGGTLD
jgi:NAD+ synthase